MTAPQPLPGTPKENLRVMRILCIALITGVVLFSIILIAVKSTSEFDDSTLKLAQYKNILLGVSIAIAIVCFLFASMRYKKDIEIVRASLISLDGKLNIFRTALIKYLALCEGAALFSVIFFFLTGDYYLFAVTIAMIIAMIAKWPGKEKIINELQLDWQQQQELE